MELFCDKAEADAKKIQDLEKQLRAYEERIEQQGKEINRLEDIRKTVHLSLQTIRRNAQTLLNDVEGADI